MQLRFRSLKLLSRYLLFSFLLCASIVTVLPAQSVTTLYTFDGSTGYPNLGLLQGFDGNLYGTLNPTSTATYGSTGGSIFKITPDGVFTTVYDFCVETGCPDGIGPIGLTQTSNGDIYGVTAGGGVYGGPYQGTYVGGTIFKITPSGKLTTLYSFCAQTGCPDGSTPTGLIQAFNGDFYGTTAYFGMNQSGTLFRISPEGVFTTVAYLCRQADLCPEGIAPHGELIQATNGDIYGLGARGIYDQGTIFKNTPNGNLTSFFNFGCSGDCSYGAEPTGLIEAANGDFYGTTAEGGAYAYGTFFLLSPSGKMTLLYSFCPDFFTEGFCSDGESPQSLIQGSNGNFFGTTIYNGSQSFDNGNNTLFEITPTGALTMLSSFREPCDCGVVSSGLMQHTNGDLYGTSVSTSTSPFTGTIFQFPTGLPPFVRLGVSSARAGDVIDILGTDLTGATSVTFNGVPASFTVLSSSLMTARVPTGAGNGDVQVVTPSATLLSNVAFRLRE